VHPLTGLVCYEDAQPLRKRYKDHVFHDGLAYSEAEDGTLHPLGYRHEADYSFVRKVIGPEREAFKVNGIWYWAVFATVPKGWLRDSATGLRPVNCIRTDIVTGKQKNTGDRYRDSKVQMSSRDLRRYGLTND
jgi:hypothetical protein